MSPAKRAWYQANKVRIIARVKAARMRRIYGITIAEYEALASDQHDCCAICGRKAEANLHGRLYPDHDHATGRVRALLCHQCNIALGALRDDPLLFDKAVVYLRAHA